MSSAIEVLPVRSSDAGPAPVEEVRDYGDWLYEAERAVKRAGRLERDDPAVQAKLRREAIEDAIDCLRMAEEKLEDAHA